MSTAKDLSMVEDEDAGLLEWEKDEDTVKDGETLSVLKAREAGPVLVRLFRQGLEDGSIQHNCGVAGFEGECVACSLIVLVNDVLDD